MRNKIRLTETDLNRIVKRVIKEYENDEIEDIIDDMYNYLDRCETIEDVINLGNELTDFTYRMNEEDFEKYEKEFKLLYKDIEDTIEYFSMNSEDEEFDSDMD